MSKNKNIKEKIKKLFGEIMDIKLEKVSIDKKDILYKLLQYSLFEESATDLNELNEYAEFEYKWFDSYFIEDDRYAYFIKSDEKLLGFVMVNTYLENKKDIEGHSIAEFMVIPKYRRKNIGKKVAIEVFEKFKGYWEVKPSLGSNQAYMFWENVIKEYTNNNYKFENDIFVFNN